MSIALMLPARAHVIRVLRNVRETVSTSTLADTSVPGTVAAVSRVELFGPERAPLLARPFFEGGDPGPIARALAGVPEQMAPALSFFGSVLGPSALAPRLKEIVVLRTSAVLACRYCVDSHTVVALDTGLSGDEVRALRQERPVAEVFVDAAELTLIDYIDAVAGTTGAVDDNVARAVAEHHRSHLVVAITLCIATTMLLNRFCTALELPTSAETIARLTREGLSVSERSEQS